MHLHLHLHLPPAMQHGTCQYHAMHLHLPNSRGAKGEKVGHRGRDGPTEVNPAPPHVLTASSILRHPSVALRGVERSWEEASSEASPRPEGVPKQTDGER